MTKTKRILIYVTALACAGLLAVACSGHGEGQEVAGSGLSSIRRIPTPDGWLVYYKTTKGAAACFVPDANHEWVLEEDR
jgi:hypothetical protein